MKKIKDLWNRNRVLFVLFIIVVICILIILGVFISYFFGSQKSNYGDRLDGIEDVEVTDEMQNSYLEYIKSDEAVNDATIKVKGKIIYIRIVFNSGISLVEAESKALESLTNFSDEYQEFYDFNFTLKQEATEDSEGFIIMGAKNVNGSGLVWNNNTPVTSDEE